MQCSFHYLSNGVPAQLWTGMAHWARQAMISGPAALVPMHGFGRCCVVLGVIA